MVFDTMSESSVADPLDRSAPCCILGTPRPAGGESKSMTTAFLVGAALALGVGVFATLVGLDRDRAFYPTVLIVIASIYELFAVIGDSGAALKAETLAFAGFACLAVIGFRKSLWLVVLGLAAHGLFDFFRGDLIANPGVPAWWPMFCLAYDLVAAAYLAWLLVRRASAETSAPIGS